MTTTSEDFDNSDDDDYDNNNDNDDHNDEDNNNDDDNDNDDNDDNANNANNDDAFVFVYLCRRRTSLKIFACQEQHVCEMEWKGREKRGDGQMENCVTVRLCEGECVGVCVRVCV